MNDPRLALALYALYLGTAFIARSIIQRRSTGSTGFRGISGRPGSAEWTGGVLFVAALALGVLAPVLQLAGTVDPIATLDSPTVAAAGAAPALAGTALTLLAQHAMGRAWRIGVDHAETTELVTTGPFSIVRNPVFAAMLPTAAGLALIAPNPVAILAVALLVIALELQTRVVEEPYLLATHGDRYADYAHHVGRFLPGLGRLHPATSRSTS